MGYAADRIDTDPDSDGDPEGARIFCRPSEAGLRFRRPRASVRRTAPVNDKRSVTWGR